MTGPIQLWYPRRTTLALEVHLPHYISSTFLTVGINYRNVQSVVYAPARTQTGETVRIRRATRQHPHSATTGARRSRAWLQPLRELYRLCVRVQWLLQDRHECPCTLSCCVGGTAIHERLHRPDMVVRSPGGRVWLLGLAVTGEQQTPEFLLHAGVSGL